MISIKEFMELCDYKLTEGSNYGWNSFGPNTYTLSAWNGEHDGWSLDITFDTRTHLVYQAAVCDYKRQRAYRMIHPDFDQQYRDEATHRDVLENQAWDEVNYVDLDVDDDFIQKCLAIVADEDYDTRVSVSVEFSSEELLQYMQLAHERDITFNQLIENVLQNFVAAHATGTSDPIDFPEPKRKKKAKK